MEFGRAALNKILAAEGRTPLRYAGILREEHTDVKPQLSSQVYSWWDGSSSAPPARRPSEVRAAETPSLTMLAYRDGEPVWPEEYDSKFPPGSDEQKEILLLKAEFEKNFPRRAAQPAAGVVTGHEARVNAVCEYTVDAPAPDLQKVVQLEVTVPVNQFSEKSQLDLQL